MFVDAFSVMFFFLPVLKDLVSLLAFKNEERMPLQGPSVFVFLILSEVLIYSAFCKRNDSVEFYSLAWVVCIT